MIEITIETIRIKKWKRHGIPIEELNKIENSSGIIQIEKPAIMLVYINRSSSVLEKNLCILINSHLYNTYKDKVDNITELLKCGQSIKPYLNRDVKHIFKKNCPKDFLLNDWDLYHLHLGELKPNANFCDRTKYVLFCRITNNDVYLIQILDHTEDSSFACRQLLTIIRDNWIEQFNVHKLNDILGMEREFSDSEYRQLREAGICTILNIDGDYCISPNMGVASSGDSSMDVQIAMRQFHVLEVLQKHILNSSKKNL